MIRHFCDWESWSEDIIMILDKGRAIALKAMLQIIVQPITWKLLIAE
jgi:hypothetical protein